MERDDLLLIHRYLNGDLEATELASFYQKVSASPEMQEALARLSFDEVLTSEVLSEQRAETEAAKQVPSRKRRPATARRWGGHPPSFAWAWALAAAGLLVGLAVLVSLPSSGSRRGSAAPPKDLAGTGPDRPREDDQERVKARQEAEQRLADIRRRRQVLEADPSPPGAELERVRRIEAEMQAFVKKLRDDRPAADTPKPVPPPASQQPSPEPAPQEPADVKPRPTQVTETAVASVGRLEGEVFLGVEGNRQPVRAGQDLLQGHALKLGPNALVEVTYRDKTRLEVRGEAEFRDVAESGSRAKRLFVAAGTVTAEVTRQPLGFPMVFQTPHGEAKVLGTTLRLVVEQSATRLDVMEGKVRLTRKPDGKFVDVTAGHFAVAATGVDLALKAAPADEILLTPRDGVSVKGYGTWSPVPDKDASTGVAWHGTSIGRPDLKNCSHVAYSFRADADKDYYVWVLGRAMGTKDPLISDHLIIVVPDSAVTASPPGAASLGGSADFNGFSDRPGYWWVGGNDYPTLVNTPVLIRFTRPGLQTLKLYAWEGPIRVDAIWLSATQKTRPDANQHGPVRAGK